MTSLFHEFTKFYHSFKNPQKQGTRENILSKKIDCSATIRVNFDLKSQLFLISQFETNHNHPLSANIYQQYPNVRKPSEKELTEMVNVVDLGANVNKVVRRSNNNNDKSLKNQDFWNRKAKLKKELKAKDHEYGLLVFKIHSFGLNLKILKQKIIFSF